MKKVLSLFVVIIFAVIVANVAYAQQGNRPPRPARSIIVNCTKVCQIYCNPDWSCWGHAVGTIGRIRAGNCWWAGGFYGAKCGMISRLVSKAPHPPFYYGERKWFNEQDCNCIPDPTAMTTPSRKAR